MSTLIKYVVGHTYKPLLEKYLSRKRIYKHNGFKLEIPPEVFHPGFFFSTKLLMQQLERFSLNGKAILELGAGSGLISMHAAEKGATVTATDINRIAVEQLKANAEKNGVPLKVIHSDLFKEIAVEQFDYIFINPPYYKKDPVKDLDWAWCCGTNGEYFQQLFAGIGDYMHAKSEVLMVLCDGCDLQMIERMAMKNGFVLRTVLEKKNLVETNFIFKIEKIVERKSDADSFVDLYIGLRSKEGRMYTDEELNRLPDIRPDHPLAGEWALRKNSAAEIYVYHFLQRKPFDILEIGCGNGWLTHKLSTIKRCRASGIDINEPELEQAKRVFGESDHLRFINGDIRDGVLKNRHFDVIIFAASIQYFDNLEEILDCALRHLAPGGKIHIMDSFFYKQSQQQAARMRSRKYFEMLGFPAMFGYYFHHSFSELKKFKYKMLFTPESIYSRIDKRKRMFPWIIIEGKR
jgi:release factor glutamine methyltransferase